MHSTDFVNSDISRSKEVVVIGGSKSAIDIVLESSKVSKKSTIVYKNTYWAVPRNIAGIIPMQFILVNRLGQALISWYKGN